MDRPEATRKKAEAAKKVWESLTEHVNRGEQAEALLRKIYLEIGPYRDGKLEDRTWSEVRDFYGFDDSE